MPTEVLPPEQLLELHKARVLGPPEAGGLSPEPGENFIARSVEACQTSHALPHADSAQCRLQALLVEDIRENALEELSDSVDMWTEELQIMHGTAAG